MTHCNAFVTKTHWNNEELKALNNSQLLDLSKQVDALLLERGTEKEAFKPVDANE